jgi:hypothetical protein
MLASLLCLPMNVRFGSEADIRNGYVWRSSSGSLGITVKVLAEGTGQALDTARRGGADVVFVHDKSAEAVVIDGKLASHPEALILRS